MFANPYFRTSQKLFFKKMEISRAKARPAVLEVSGAGIGSLSFQRSMWKVPAHN